MIGDPIDISDITASVINSQINEVKTWLKGSLSNFWTKHFTTFKKHLNASYKRHSITKTLLYKDRPVKVSDLYVKTRLECTGDAEVIEDVEIFEKIENAENLLITATAGSGKTFFAKFVFLSIIARKKQIPVLIELRNVSDFTNGIIEVIANEFKNSNIPIEHEILQGMLDTGKFVIILDGYDEIESKSVDLVNRKIIDFVAKVPNCPLIITSRPDDRLEYLGSFRNYKVLPLEIDQAIELVEKLNYDKTVKDLFLENLRNGLFNRHSDFTSNPLLLTILLLTYEEIAEIPNKIHIFYDQAFDVLYYKHDASKGMYRREIRSGLAADDFKDILACISASGYLREKITFTHTDLVNYIRKAKKTTGIMSFSPDNYKHDLLTTVCVLVQDGLKFTYNHRSFQEYFAAYFITKFSIDNKIELYFRYIERGVWDNALYLAYEMNRDLVENEFIYPVLKDMIQECGEDQIKYLKKWFSGFDIQWQSTRRRIHIPSDSTKTHTKPSSKKTYKPSYKIKDASKYWHFVLFLERIYKLKGKRKTPSFRKILTKKRFKAVFPNYEMTRSITFSKLSKEDKSVLDKTGLIESVDPRVKRLTEILNDIEGRMAVRNASSIEDWL